MCTFVLLGVERKTKADRRKVMEDLEAERRSVFFAESFHAQWLHSFMRDLVFSRSDDGKFEEDVGKDRTMQDLLLDDCSTERLR